MIKMTVDEIKKYLINYTDDQTLADIYNEVHMKWVYEEDATYDYEEGTEEFTKQSSIFDQWDKLLIQLEAEIFNRMGCSMQDNQPTIKVIEGFMNKNGYYNRNGWWLTSEEIRKYGCEREARAYAAATGVEDEWE